jgi:hypothetical protein
MTKTSVWREKRKKEIRQRLLTAAAVVAGMLTGVCCIRKGNA